MTAKQIYSLKPIKVTTDVEVLTCTSITHIPELEFEYIDENLNEKVEIKYYVDYCFDGRRTWTLASVWYINKPVMIIQNAGREGDDCVSRFITNEKLYYKMVEYLKSLIQRKEEITDLLDENEENPSLTNFYSYSIEEFYDENYIPKYKVGDIVDIKIPKTPYTYISEDAEMISAKAEILDVYKMPYDSYRLMILDRKIHRKIWSDDNDKTFTVDISEINKYKDVKFENMYVRLNKDLEWINVY